MQSAARIYVELLAVCNFTMMSTNGSHPMFLPSFGANQLFSIGREGGVQKLH
jgi:hypothetical protein